MIAKPRMARSSPLTVARAVASGWGCAIWLFLAGGAVSGESLDAAHAPTLAGTLPDTGASIFRVCGAFFFVVAVFLGGVWLFRNWQRFSVQKHGGAKLSLIEVKSLGQRQAVYVVGYQQQRMLLASSPTGVTLLCHLPEAGEAGETVPPVRLNFAEALQHVLSRRQ